MSKAPTEPRTNAVELSDEQQWVLHHRVVTLADEHLSAGDDVPDWLVESFERLESDGSSLPERAIDPLEADLRAYVEDPETPSSDAKTATAILDALSDRSD
ncbi:hypothetical protein [Halovivax limisalsi]|uniref:DUF7853 family protein n=1 Tax=Halovivax limisalsi TaxID=1453760 RepID=UPI001FFDDA27|nr:hypothetical protein [Halovivax limisalsi]